MSIEESDLGDEIAKFVEAVKDFTEYTDTIYRDLLQSVANVLGYPGDAGWPPSDEFIDWVIETFSAPGVLEGLSLDEGSELLCRLDEIRQMRAGGAS